MTDAATTTPIQSATEAMREVLGGYDPQNLMSALQVFPDLAEHYDGMAENLTALAARLDESPVHETLRESLREQAGVFGGLADQAREAHAQAQSLHEDDIRRINEPRTGENMADFEAHQ
jgi:hypothetical protein